jgi:hypothetical protein
VFIATSYDSGQMRYNNVSIKLPVLTGRSANDGIVDTFTVKKYGLLIDFSRKFNTHKAIRGIHKRLK